jgi:uncharacterized protein
VHGYLNRLMSRDVPGAMALLHEQVVFDEPRSLPYGGLYEGHAGFLRMLRKMTKYFDVALADPHVHDCGNRLIVDVNAEFVSHTSGKSARVALLEAYTIASNSQIIRVDPFYKDPAVLVNLG